VAAPPPAVAPPPPVVVPPPVAPSEPAAAEEEGQAEEEGEVAPEAPTPGRRGGKSARPSAAAPADNKKLLQEGERLLRAERFPEARRIFEKLSQSKRDRGLALVGLAEISFQEKNYAQAVKSAKLAADRGGGVRAHVLQGDAQFRLNHFKEAAKAYEQALKLDPMNASAKSGLALANKRM
jgi:tetratricopeptide (TPR) repeat protein